jgi:hypothetical protein
MPETQLLSHPKLQEAIGYTKKRGATLASQIASQGLKTRNSKAAIPAQFNTAKRQLKTIVSGKTNSKTLRKIALLASKKGTKSIPKVIKSIKRTTTQ